MADLTSDRMAQNLRLSKARQVKGYRENLLLLFC